MVSTADWPVNRVKIAILHQGYRVLVFFLNSYTSFQKVTFANRSPEFVWVSVEYSRSCCCDGSVPQSIKKVPAEQWSRIVLSATAWNNLWWKNTVWELWCAVSQRIGPWHKKGNIFEAMQCSGSACVCKNYRGWIERSLGDWRKTALRDNQLHVFFTRKVWV